MILAEPPSIRRDEITDEGSINQRATPAHRAAPFGSLHADGPDVIRPAGGTA